MKDSIEAMARVRAELGRAIVGQEGIVDLALIALLCEGHILFEGLPGLGKTLLARSLASCLSLRFSRLQFTPDLMPADVIGAAMLEGREDSGFRLSFEEGPVFANVVLADEINRASPKTQSALLEAMQERTVTVRGESYPLPRPFMVLATQNPIELEGTYPLPEAQIDRFLFKAIIRQPGKEDLTRIMELTLAGEPPVLDPVLGAGELIALQRAVRDVVAPPPLLDLTARLVLSTQPERPESPEKVRRLLRFGAGPRGAQALVLSAKARALMDGRPNASFADLERSLLPALRHRIALNFEGQSSGLVVDELLLELMAAAKAEVSFGKALGASAAS